MQLTEHDLGHRDAGDVVEIALSGNAANVRLLDSTNLDSYKNGRQYRFYGGLAKRSLIRLQVPDPGCWHVVVDLHGLAGNVRSAVRVLS